MKTKNKIIIIIGAIGIFLFLEAIAILLFWGVFISAPIENINSITNDYNGMFFYLLIGVYGLSTGAINLKSSLDLSNKIVKLNLEKKE